LSPAHFAQRHSNSGFDGIARCPHRPQMRPSIPSASVITLNSPLSTQYGQRTILSRLRPFVAGGSEFTIKYGLVWGVLLLSLTRGPRQRMFWFPGCYARPPRSSAR